MTLTLATRMALGILALQLSGCATTTWKQPVRKLSEAGLCDELEMAIVFLAPASRDGVPHELQGGYYSTRVTSGILLRGDLIPETLVFAKGVLPTSDDGVATPVRAPKAEQNAPIDAQPWIVAFSLSSIPGHALVKQRWRLTEQQSLPKAEKAKAFATRVCDAMKVK